MMNLNRLLQSFGRLSLSSLNTFSADLCYRSVSTSSAKLKNFKGRLPYKQPIGKFRPLADEDVSKKTLKPLRVAKGGGRGPDGRIWIHCIGGGRKLRYRWIDQMREGPENGETLVERITYTGPDSIRTGHLAVAVNGNQKRYITATAGLKRGDLIKTSGVLTQMPIQAYDGDSHPIGSLPLGTKICLISVLPGNPRTKSLAAGTSAMYIKKVDNQCLVRLPSTKEILIDQKCMVTVGQISNVTWSVDKKVTSWIDAKNQRGCRPRSGLWQRKTGRMGRKIRATKPPIVYDGPPGFKSNYLSYRVEASKVCFNK